MYLLLLLLKCNTITKRQTQHPNTKAHRFFIKSGSIFLKMRRFDDDAALLRCARFEKSLSLAFLWRVEELGLEEQGFVHSLHGTLHVLHLRVGVPFEKSNSSRKRDNKKLHPGPSADRTLFTAPKRVLFVSFSAREATVAAVCKTVSGKPAKRATLTP